MARSYSQHPCLYYKPIREFHADKPFPSCLCPRSGTMPKETFLNFDGDLCSMRRIAHMPNSGVLGGPGKMGIGLEVG